jgi:MoaA/NifB/PqqE/SkfB family radical SAM enzyme
LEGIILKGVAYPRLLQNIITNGQNIDERWADALVRANVHIKISIDGATAEVYERIRVGAKFANILKSVENLHSAMERQNRRIRLWIHMVVQKFNYHEIEAMVEFAREHGFDGVAFSPMEEGTDQRRVFDIFNYGDDRRVWAEVEAQRVRAREKSLRYGLYLEDNLPSPHTLEESPHALAEPEDQKRFSLLPVPKDDGSRYAEPQYSYFCLSPWKNLILRNGGDVFPNWHCGERSLGNMHQHSIMDIWNGPVMRNVRQAIRDQRFGGLCRKFCLSGALMEPWKHQMEWYWS